MTTTTPPLNREEIRTRYDEDGYVARVPVFTPAEMAGFRKRFDALEAELGREKCVTGLLDWHFDHEFIWRLATGTRVIEAIQAAIGDDVMLMATHFFCKYPEKEGAKYVAWHQDVTYWGLEPPEAHTAWIAVDDADAENGAMQVVRGSHRLGPLPHGKSGTGNNLLSVDQAVPEEHVDRDEIVQLELKAGEISLHHGYTLHASMPNRSDRRRCGLTARFIAPHVRSNRDKWKPVLVAGEDRCHHFGDRPKPFPLPA